jgi:hypothetical protein
MRWGTLLLALSLVGLLAGGIIYASQNSEPIASGGPPIDILFRVYGLEGDDEAMITVTRNGEYISHTYAVVDEEHYRANGAYGISIGVALDPPEDGVYVLKAYAEGYTVEPESYDVEVRNRRPVDYRERVYEFVFQKVS